LHNYDIVFCETVNPWGARNLGNFEKSSALSEIGEHWIEKFCAMAQVVIRRPLPAVSIPAKCM